MIRQVSIPTLLKTVAWVLVLSSCDKPFKVFDSRIGSEEVFDKQSDSKPVDDSEGVPGYTKDAAAKPMNLILICEHADGAPVVKPSIACTVFEKDGRRYIGALDELNATVTYKNGQSAGGEITRASAGAPYDFLVVTEKNGEVFSVEAKFSADGKPQILTAKVFLPQQKTSADLTLYVSTLGNDSAGCTLESPCLSIMRAISLLPERLNHKVEILVAAGSYKEALVVQDLSFGQKGSLLIAGVGPNHVGGGVFIVDSTESNAAAAVFRNLSGTVKIANGKFSGGSKNGANLAQCSTILFSNVTISGNANGMYVAGQSNLFLDGDVLIEKNSGSGLMIVLDSHVYVTNPTSNLRVKENAANGIIVQGANLDFYGDSLIAEGGTGTALSVTNYAMVHAHDFGRMEFRSVGPAAVYIANYSTMNIRQNSPIGEKFFSARRESAGTVIAVDGDSRFGVYGDSLRLSLVSGTNSMVGRFAADTNSILTVFGNPQCSDCTGSAYIGFGSAILLRSSNALPGAANGNKSYLPSSSPAPLVKDVFEGR